jgi:hypothetical protein
VLAAIFLTIYSGEILNVECLMNGTHVIILGWGCCVRPWSTAICAQPYARLTIEIYLEQAVIGQSELCETSIVSCIE